MDKDKTRTLRIPMNNLDTRTHVYCIYITVDAMLYMLLPALLR